ncbi:solute carrier family 22 member 14-like [Saccopteryx bilineata]|uniref:solute carrier family 22 member 14-like n=1 Tax=Saccopteryx bilineata TaxID=59482 RepID=UPI00338EB6B0
MACVCFSVGYCFMTLGFTLREFGAKFYTSQIIPGIVGVPARLCTIFLLEQLGRKWSLAVTLLQGTIVTLLILSFSSELKSSKLLMILLGEFSLQSSIVVVFIYIAELLPTVVSENERKRETDKQERREIRIISFVVAAPQLFIGCFLICALTGGGGFQLSH